MSENLPSKLALADELAHAHSCPHCGVGRYCEVMICRSSLLKACWSCRKRGLE